MASSSPQIGFDRFIAIEWAAAALKVRAELGTLDELNALLDAAGLGVAARKKTRTVLNRLWLAPRPELADFAERGVAILKADPSVPIAALTWGMAIATYPFFGKVAELVGRLSALQGDCASAEVHTSAKRCPSLPYRLRSSSIHSCSISRWGTSFRRAQTWPSIPKGQAAKWFP